MEWQPIKTAPKDGTIIDLWHKEFHRQTDCMWGLPHHTCGEAGRYCDSEWHGAKRGWVDTTFNDFVVDGTLTHWMPLPEPPK